MQTMTNINDRCRLVLYNYLSLNRSLRFTEKREFKKLERIYIDNNRYQDELQKGLFDRGFLMRRYPPIELIAGVPYREDKWRDVTGLPYETEITELGEKALKSGLLPSETKKHLRDQILQWIPIVVSVIALIISWKNK